MAEQQLERSILERKERDEIHAIALGYVADTGAAIEEGRHYRSHPRGDGCRRRRRKRVGWQRRGRGRGGPGGAAGRRPAREAGSATRSRSPTRRTSSAGADPAVVVDTEDVVPDSDESPATAGVSTPPRQAPRFDDGDATVNPVAGEDESDGHVFARTTAVRPVAGRIARSVSPVTVMSTRRTGVAGGAVAAGVATCNPVRRSPGRVSSSP